jgi:glyoxylase-like metal-dependent hydrolase (beta-lactamase superfamily II)
VWAPVGEVDDLRHGTPRGGFPVGAHEPEHTVAGGEEVTVAGITFQVVDVPGHSAGHVAFFAEGELFSGDVLFAGSVGRTDLQGGDWETLVASIRALMERFPPQTVVRPGHGPATTLGRELQTNPFLRELRADA